MTSGIVFNIQPYSLHDGPGIRTVVFLKGCPLRCIWCSNPESQRREPELSFDKSKCIYGKGCRRCGGYMTETELLSGTLSPDGRAEPKACADVCPSRALRVYGGVMTVDGVIDRAERESVFYRGGGGITLSGGEPFLQGEFAVELLKEAKRRRLHTAVETCGCCDTRTLYEAAAYIDYILFDVKFINERKHIRYTGSSNRKILDNLDMLFREFPDMPKRIRTPVIPSVNDTAEDIGEISGFLSGYENYEYELLPYHRFGQGKYAMLGRTYADIPERLSETVLEELKKFERR